MLRASSTLLRLRVVASLQGACSSYSAPLWPRTRGLATDRGRFNLDDLPLDTGLNEEELDMGIRGGSKSALLDPENPPKLTHAHYQLLKGIDFSGRKERHEKKNREKRQEWAKKVVAIEALTRRQFGFDPEEIMQVKSFRPSFEEPAPSVFDEHPPQPLTEFEKEAAFQKENLPREDPIYGFDPRIAGQMWTDPRSLSLLDRQVPINLNLKRKGKCIFRLPDPSRNEVKEIKYTNIQLLHRFINERGMIKSRKLTFVSAKYQRKLARAIKQARVIGLLSFVDNFHVPYQFANIEEAAASYKDKPFNPNEYRASVTSLREKEKTGEPSVPGLGEDVQEDPDAQFQQAYESAMSEVGVVEAGADAGVMTASKGKGRAKK